MDWQINLPFLICIAAGLATLQLALFNSNRRNLTNLAPYGLTALAVLAWMAGMLGVGSTDQESRNTVWQTVFLIGWIGLPASWANLAMRRMGKTHAFVRYEKVLLVILPTGLLLFALTNIWHGFMWDFGADGDRVIGIPGWAGWLALAFGFTAIFSGLYALASDKDQTKRHDPAVQNAIILAGGCALALTISAVVPLSSGWREWIQASLGLILLGALSWILLSQRETSPVEALQLKYFLETGMGILVLDQDNNIEWVNEAACRMLANEKTLMVGKHVSIILPQIVTTEILLRDTQTRISHNIQGKTQIFEATSQAINKREQKTGSIVTLRDITATVTEEKEQQRVKSFWDVLLLETTLFRTPGNWKQDMRSLLGGLGKELGADRLVVAQNQIDTHGRLCASLRYEWDASKEYPISDPTSGQKYPYEMGGLERWAVELGNGATVSTSLGDKYDSEHQWLIERGAGTITVTPLRTTKEWWGFLAFERKNEENHWNVSEIELIRQAGDSVSAILERRQTQEGLRSAYLELERRLQTRNQELADANSALKTDLEARKQAERIAEQRANQLEALHQATTGLLLTLDLETLLSQILDAATDAIPAAKKGMLYMIAQDTGQLEMKAVMGYTDPRIKKYTFPKNQGYVAQAVQEQKPMLILDTGDERAALYKAEISELQQIRSMMIAPLISDEVTYGALTLDSSTPDAFTEDDLKLLVSFAATATAALRNAQLHSRVQRLAITDALTGVYNRRGFEEFGRRIFESAKRFKRPLSMLLIDIDHFKEINDTYGHAAGDQVLVAIAERLARNVREVDMIGRYGGDEFMVMLPETDVFTAMMVAERLHKAITEGPMMSDHGAISVKASLGVARLSTDTSSMSRLLDLADQALYEAKEEGRNRIKMHPMESDQVMEMLDKNG